MTDLAPLTEWKTELTEELLAELFRVHAEGKDFRNVTAIRCGVHPTRFKNWLRWGETSSATNGAARNMTINSRLYLGFVRIEAEQRASCIAEVLNTETKREETDYDEKTGMPTRTVKTSRSPAGVQWYMERRWRQFRNDWVPNEQDSEVILMANQQAAGTLTAEAAVAIVAQLAKAMPPQLVSLFTAEGWTPPKQLETATDGET